MMPYLRVWCNCRRDDLDCISAYDGQHVAMIASLSRCVPTFDACMLHMIRELGSVYVQL